MRRARRAKYRPTPPGLARVVSAAAEMQYPLTTKKSGTPTQNRPTATSTQSNADPPAARTPASNPAPATYPAEWKTTTSRHATPRQTSSDSYRDGVMPNHSSLTPPRQKTRNAKHELRE